MDPLTHGLLGAAISYAAFGKRLGRQAALVGALAGIAPDADNFVSSKEDVLLYVEFHRAFTHSIAFSFVGALIVILPWIVRKRFRPQWKMLWLCAWPAYLSHCFLDASTTYGTQLLWPFTRNRYGWDWIAVIDPLFTIVLIVALILALKKRRPLVTGLGVVFCAGYLMLGALQKTRAVRVQAEIAKERGHEIERYEIMPTIANLMVWRSLYLFEGKIYSDRIRVGITAPPSFREGTSRPLLAEDQLSAVERLGNERTRAFSRFSWFSDDWVARSPFDDTALGDMRYSISAEAFDPIWGIRFREKDGKIRVEWINRQLQRRIDPKELWSEIIGKHPKFRPVH